MASRILLADDSITIQKVVNLTFADEGIEVVAVSNGDQAERRLADVKPDLVLADIFMPGKNGYELCEAIKESPEFRNVPVVLLVGAFEPFDQAEARRVRADAHLTKPFESRTLVETVRRLISASPRTTTGPIAPLPPIEEERHERLSAAAPAVAAPVVATPGLASQLAGKLDLSAMRVDNGVATAPTPMVRNTGELASPAPDAQQEVLDLGFVDTLSQEAVTATLTDTSKRFEPLEFSPSGDFSLANADTRFSMDANPSVQDFDLPVSTPPSSQDPISFETETPAEIETELGAGSESEDWFDRSSLDTTKLNTPAGDGSWQSRNTGAPLGYQSPDFRLQTDAAFNSPQTSTETACATLLAVDEPLGDVLFDETVSGDPLAFSETSPVDPLALSDTSSVDSVAFPEHSSADPLAFSEELSADPLTLSETSSADSVGFDFMETVAESGPDESTHFALVETVAESSPQETAGFEDHGHPLESLAAEETPSPDNEMVSTAASQAPVAQPDAHDVEGDLDWTTPRAASYSTAQLDSVVMPLETAEYLAQNAVEESPQPEKTEDAAFTAPAMWTEEEARFTPIDIEAVSVDEGSVEDMSAVETGFAFAPALPEPAAPSFETPVASATNGHGSEAASASGLSTSAIEEIVRRVVAQMSESVVREVAWEVVPDCVERVIEQLTRESLSKRA